MARWETDKAGFKGPQTPFFLSFGMQTAISQSSSWVQEGHRGALSL